MRYSTKQPIRLSTTVRDITGALVNAGALTLTVAKPDASTQVYSSPVNDSTGNYHQDIPVADLGQVGHYQYEWVSTGTGAGEAFGDFDVFDGLADTAILSLQDAKDFLNIPQATTTSDAEIYAFLATIETSIEGLTGGPVVNRTITAERCVFLGWYEALQVKQRPLVSVSSITSVKSGTALDVTSLDINGPARMIRRKDCNPFSSDSTVVLVTYVAGWGLAVPAAVNMAARVILGHLWETQHGPTARPSMGAPELVTPPGFGYAIPNYASQLLQGSLNGMPFADQVFAW